MKKIFLLLFISILTGYAVSAQTCTTLGQNPGTAFPVCGTAVFNQSTVPPCGGATITAPGCTLVSLSDINPYWYKFHCYSSGTLSFTLTPNNLADDYDWQLFDVTNRPVTDVYNGTVCFVSCNWSGEVGITGASTTATDAIVCGTSPGEPTRPLFSKSPNIIAGHDYLLLVSHFLGDQQSGYGLEFAGGTAVITDPLDPHITRADAGCDGTTITIKLNKKMKCSSLTPNGSEFTINPPGNNIISAIGAGCANSFDMDSVILTLSNPIAPGNYTISIGPGIPDNNSLLDNCGREIPPETLPLVVFPLIPTPMDSLTKPIGCSPTTLELVFRKPIKCSSFDGSEFTITGPYIVNVVNAVGNCTNDLTTKITLTLDKPLQVAGNFTVNLRAGNDGNTIYDACSQQSPPGSLPFSVKDTVNANFSYNVLYGCQQNTVQYSHNGANGVNSWLWSFDGTQSSNLQNPVITYTNFETKNTQLIVSNGVCSDTASQSLFFDNLLHANFEVTNIVCPGDKAVIKNTTIGNIVNWDWSFGNGSTSSLQDPPAQTYNVANTTYGALVKLIVTNNYGCKDSLAKIIKVINNCYIAVPSAFSPNGDGLNDYLYPLNAYKAINLDFSVYNRFGQLLFHTTDWTNKWDGTFKGQGADPGTYVWILRYTNADTGKLVEQKGSVVLIR